MAPLTDAVRRTLAWYDGERPGVKANLARLLMHGRPGGSGKLVILPVDHVAAAAAAVTTEATELCKRETVDAFFARIGGQLRPAA